VDQPPIPPPIPQGCFQIRQGKVTSPASAGLLFWRARLDRFRPRSAVLVADSSPRLPHSTTHRKIAGGVSCHSPRQISFAASPFSSLRLDSCREQATKKTPDEEPAKKVHWGASSFARSATSVASKGCGERARLAETRHGRLGLMGVARSETFGC
jgi:hypothetical protein